MEKVTSGLNGLDHDDVMRLLEENYKPYLVALKRAVEGVLSDMD